MNLAIVNRLVGSFFDRLKAHSVKAEDPGRGGEPEVSIGRLLNVDDRSKTIV